MTFLAPYRRSMAIRTIVTISMVSLIVAILTIPVARSTPGTGEDHYSLAAGQTLQIAAPGVLENDPATGNETLTVSIASNATQGTLKLAADGSFSYQPGPDFAGIDVFSYIATNGKESSVPTQVTITWPNVVLIVVDDVGLGDIKSYNPESGIHLPNLEKLAATGLSFANAHATASVCAPSRYSIMTGNYPYRGLKAGGVRNAFAQNTMIIPGQQTLGNLMHTAGYSTAFIGKLHNGGAFWSQDNSGYAQGRKNIDFSRSFDRGPTQFGFDYSFLLPSGLSHQPYAYFENDRLVRFNKQSDTFSPFPTNAAANQHLVQIARGEK
jgi:hypothetical protein